jgi:uncharacterized membrane protein YfhO
VRRELAAPGWEARVNGTPQPIAVAGEIFQSIALPAGHSDIAFAYAPPGMDWAWLACGLGTLGCLIWGTWQKWLKVPTKHARRTQQKR